MSLREAYIGVRILDRADPSADSQLNLLEKRVRGRMLGEDTFERMLEVFGAVCEDICITFPKSGQRKAGLNHGMG